MLGHCKLQRTPRCRAAELPGRHRLFGIYVCFVNEFERWLAHSDDHTHISWIDEERCTPSLLMYSVFLSHGTWAGVDIDEDGAGPDGELVANGTELNEGSPSKNRSFGSNGGRLSGSGFKAIHIHVTKLRKSTTRQT